VIVKNQGQRNPVCRWKICWYPSNKTEERNIGWQGYHHLPSQGNHWILWLCS